MSTYVLPPLGQIGENDHAMASGYLQGLVQEAIEARSEWTELADSNLTIYTFGDDPAPSDDVITVNEIQNAVIAITDIQTKEPAQATLEPVETGEPPERFWAGPAPIGLQIGLAPQQLAPWVDETGQQQPPLPIEEGQADQIHMLIEAGQLKEQWLVEVNDQLVADTYQPLFDVYFDRSKSPLFLRQNILETNIQGWAWGLYEFDDDTKRHCLRHLSVRQVYVDPTIRDIQDASYAGVDLVLDANEAKKLYPALAQQIDDHSRQGVPDRYDSNVNYGQQFNDRNFRRDMIVLRVFWLRNQPCPYTPEQAVGAGAVQPGQVPMEPVETPAEQNAPFYPAAGGTQAGTESVPGDATADDGSPPPSAAPPMRPAMVHPETGEEMTASHPDWPTRTCLRQITEIAGIIVDDRECEFFDIPLLHNVNIPVPGRPWGLGEPMRLKGLQRARSRMVDSISQHCEFFKSPLTTISQSMYDIMPDAYKDGHIKPGMVLIVPDQQWDATGGKVHNFIDPPTTPPALVDFQEILRNEITEQSGHSEVLQGRAQPQVKSGKAIELLQTASSSMIGFKSQRTGDVVKRMAELMLHSLVWRLSVQDVYRVVSQYPTFVLEAICKRAQRIEWDINVIISSGSGATLQRKKQEAQGDLQLGAISMETYRDKARIDHRVETQRIAGEQMQMAKMQAALAPQPEGKPGENKQGNEPQAA